VAPGDAAASRLLQAIRFGGDIQMPPTGKLKDAEIAVVAQWIGLALSQLSPGPPADKARLIRRATLDLTGLPPTPQQVADFLQDSAPDAFARLVDRLLASPEYGRRWGRHWLDVVRYADTAGETADYPVPLAANYRDWVIDAFNCDMPYDAFLRAQIAGDLIAERTGAVADQ
jgi:hypothetical protein